MEHNCQQKEKIDQVWTFIEGNGKPGAKVDLAGMKVRMTLLIWLFGLQAAMNIAVIVKVLSG